MKVTYLKLDDLDLYTDELVFYPRNLFTLDSSVYTNDTLNDGKSFNYSKINDRKFVLNGIIKSNVYNNILKISGIAADNNLKRIELGVEGLPNLYINANLVNLATSEPWNNEMSMQFSAPDPCLYSVDSQTISLGSVSASSLAYPITYPITFGSITGGQGVVTNSGNTKAYPVITIIGTCSNITVTNETTGESMSLDVSLSDSDTLVIDNSISNRGIYLNGNKRMDLKNGSWFSCVPGDNVFSFTRSSLEAKQHCSVSLQSRWK